MSHAPEAVGVASAPASATAPPDWLMEALMSPLTCVHLCVLLVLTCSSSPPTSVPLSPAANLRLSDVTHSSARVTWTSPSAQVSGYRIMYVRTDGVQTSEVRQDLVLPLPPAPPTASGWSW